MTQNEADIRNIIGIIPKTTLGKGIELLKELQSRLPWLHISEQAETIENNYRLMKEYLSRDIEDAYRGKMYADMTTQLKHIALDGLREILVHDNESFASLKVKSGGLVVSSAAILPVLQSFVQDIAMASIGVSTETDAADIYRKRQGYLDRLFNAMLFDGSWSAEKADDMSQLALEPTVDTHDAMLIVSATMLSAVVVPDYNKVAMLARVYKDAADESLRQRALVGWVLSAVTSAELFHDEICSIVNPLLDDENVRNEVLELAIQIVYCNNAEKDNEYLERNVYPEIIRNRNFNITKNGIEEKEDDPMDDILDPGAADRKIEEMEQSVKKILDMQKSGADIYFGGFRQMKRFSFFYTLSNWFMPFYLNHPGLSHVLQTFSKSPVLEDMLNRNSFCDSDKYSIVLAFSSIFDKLPDNIKETLRSDRLNEMLGKMPQDANLSPAFIRRAYLQDLYRFYKVYPQKNSFDDIFLRYSILLANSPLAEKMPEEIRLFSKFLVKRGVNPTSMLMACFDNNSIDDLLLMAFVKMKEGDYATAFDYYHRAYLTDDTNYRALKGSALAAFRNSDYTMATELYDKVFDIKPDEKLGHKLKHCIARFHAGRLDEAVNDMYRLSFEYPDNIDVVRTLAYGQLIQGKVVQALKNYGMLIEKSPAPSDKLYSAYCCMHLKQWGRAIDLLHQYAQGSRERISEAFNNDMDIIVSLGIKPSDLQIVEDAAMNG